MKKFLTLALSALLTMGLLTACGGKTTDKTVDLTAFYNTLAEEYGWAEDAASSGEEDKIGRASCRERVYHPV